MSQFDNLVSISVKDGETNELKHQIDLHNDISEDIIAYYYQLYKTPANNLTGPHCALYPDGAKWSGFTWDSKNPWCPYTMTRNRKDDANADTIYQPKQSMTNVNGKWKLFYRWTKLQDDFNLKAVGLMNWFMNDAVANGALDDITILTPDTLLILPQPITIKGRKLGNQIPDVLEVTYWLSLVGVE